MAVIVSGTDYDLDYKNAGGEDTKLITSWQNLNIDEFSSKGPIITAKRTDPNIAKGYPNGNQTAMSNKIVVKNGQKISLNLKITKISGELPKLYLVNNGWTKQANVTLKEGTGIYDFTTSWDGDAWFRPTYLKGTVGGFTIEPVVESSIPASSPLATSLSKEDATKKPVTSEKSNTTKYLLYAGLGIVALIVLKKFMKGKKG